MKIWTENDMWPITKKIDDEIQYLRRHGSARGTMVMIDLYHEITGAGRESDDLTICGFKIGDLVPLAFALQRNGISAKEVENWHKELAEMYDWMLREIQAAGDRAFETVRGGDAKA